MLLTEIGLSIPLFERGNNGVPSSNYLGIDLASRCQSYQHTIAARGGFESMRTSFVCDLDEAIDVLKNWLGRSTVVTGPDTEVIWEGQLAEVSVTLGQRRRSISLDKLANRVRCRYTDSNGSPATTSNMSSAASIAIYGTKDRAIALAETTATAAANAATQVLAQYAYPMQAPSTQIATGNLGDIQVELLFRGWYWTLGWVLTSRTSTTSTATNTQIGALIANSGVGIGVTNPFLSTSTSLIGSTGVNDTEFIASDTSYLEKIEKLVAQGDGVDRWVLMCLENRALTFRKWAGATPSTVAYVADLGGYQVYNPQGALIQPWDVRPDTMYQEIGLLDAEPVGSNADAATRQYVERVTCAVGSSGVSVTLEPAASDSLDVRLAALGG